MDHAAILARLLASGALTDHSQSQVTLALSLVEAIEPSCEIGEGAVR
jgi:hypothetical protein